MWGSELTRVGSDFAIGIPGRIDATSSGYLLAGPASDETRRPKALQRQEPRRLLRLLSEAAGDGREPALEIRRNLRGKGPLGEN